MARILIVDDESGIRDVLSRVLSRGNHDVRSCPGAQAALDEVGSWQPDLVITDVYMPEMDGIEFLLALQEEQPDLPVIAISGGGALGSAGLALEDASELGAVRTLTKPFGLEELLAAVSDVLDQ